MSTWAWIAWVVGSIAILAYCYFTAGEEKKCNCKDCKEKETEDGNTSL